MTRPVHSTLSLFSSWCARLLVNQLREQLKSIEELLETDELKGEVAALRFCTRRNTPSEFRKIRPVDSETGTWFISGCDDSMLLASTLATSFLPTFGTSQDRGPQISQQEHTTDRAI